MSPDDPDRPVLLALLGWIRYVVKENRKAAERLSKEPVFMAVTRQGFEEWMETERQKADARIRARAIQEGRTEGKAESLLRILASRGIAVSKKAREQILGCSDGKTLDRWIDRASAAGSAAELLEAN